MKYLIPWLAFFFIAGGSLYSQEYQKHWDMIESGSYTLDEIQEEANRYFKDKDHGKGSGYKQYKRWEYFAKQTADETGHLETNRTIETEITRFKKAQANKRTKKAGSNTSGNWDELGVFERNPTSSWNPGVGRVECIAVDPNDVNHILLGLPTGGAWSTKVGGNDWKPLTDDHSNLNIRGVAISPFNSNEYYIGTTGGLYKSLDQGITWNSVISSGTVIKILPNPDDANIVLVAGGSGIYRSTNGGSSFTQMKSGSFRDMVYKPNDPNTVYACDGSGFYKSTNNGQTWTSISTAGSGTGRIAVTPANPNVVYYTKASGSAFGYLFKSTNSGSSFTTQGSHTVDYYSGYSWYGIDLAVSDTDENLIYMGGMELYRSTDGGLNFTLHARWSYGNNKIKYIHADIHCLEWVNGHLYTGTDGAISIDDQNGDVFHDLSTSLGARQFYKIGVSRSDKNIVVGGAQDNGTAVMKGENHDWYEWLGADGMETFVDWSNADILYGTSQNGTLYKSTNGGQSYSGFSGPGGDGNWVTPFEQDPINANTVYVGIDGLQKKVGNGSWQRISTITSDLDEIKIAQSNNQIIYFSIGSTLYRTTNGGSSWTTMTGISGTINAIAIHPEDPNYVAVATSGGSRVYITTNGGASWAGKLSNLPSIAAKACVWQSGTDHGLYVGMSDGIYYIDDDMSQWTEFMDNMPNISISELEINYSAQIIYAGTYGRGLWVSDCYGIEAAQNDVAILSLEATTTSSCATTANVTIEAKNSGEANLTSFVIKIYSNGTLVKTENHSTSLANDEKEIINISGVTINGDGTDIVKAIFELPNGVVDEYLNNNELETSIASTDIDYTQMSIVSVSDYYGTQVASNTIDNDESTIWHSDWGTNVPMPHTIVYDLGDDYSVGAIKILNRQDNTNGIVKDIDVELSANGTDWSNQSSLVLPTAADWITEPLTGGVGRFVRLTINSNIFGSEIASLAEVRFQGCPAGGLRVAIDAPITATDFTTGDDVQVDATVTSDGTVSKVEFYLDDQLVGTDNTSAYSFTINNISEGQHTLKVIAYDDLNGSKESNEVLINVTTPIEFDIAISGLQRTDNAVCGSSIDLSFDIENKGVQTITGFDAEVYLNNQLIQTDAQTVSLTTGNSTTVSISGVALQSFGTQDLKVVLINPNNQTDEVTTDNEASVSITIGEGDLHEFFIADRSANPSLSWEIKDGSTTVVTSAEAITSPSGSNFCLGNGCFDIVITDAFSAGGCAVQAWSSTANYNGGDQVSYNGKIYEAKWWSSGKQPDLYEGSGGTDYWLVQGDCSVSYDTDTYGVRKSGETEYFTVEVQNYTSPKTDQFCNGSTSTTVDFTLNATTATNCEAVTFTSTTSPVGTAYSWNFGSGASPATATGVGPHDVTYTTVGQKTVALTVDGTTETKVNAVTITDGQVTPTVVIEASKTTICSGDQVDFSIKTQTNEGTNPSYEWFVGTTSVGTGVSHSSSTLTNGQKVKVVLTSDESCVTSSEATSDDVSITVSLPVTPTIAINASQTTICGGGQVDFTIASQSNGGTSPVIDWYVGTTKVATGISFSSTTLTDGANVKAILTSNGDCVTSATATSNIEVINVNASAIASIEIESNKTGICSGDQVDFSIKTQTNEGTNPSYEWFVGTTSVGTGSTYSSSSIADSDKVTAVLSSSEACASGTATSNEVTINVSTSVSPTIVIEASETTICGNGQVDFSIKSQMNEGTSPSYEWFVGSTSVGTGTTYSSTSLTDGDKVKVVLTSDANCVSTSTATSNEVTINVSTSVSPTIVIQASQTTICGNEQVDFTIASQSNEGTNPSYEWFVGLTSVGTATTYSSTSLTDGDKVTAVLTSDANCVSTMTVTSNEVTMNVSTSVTPEIAITLKGQSFPVCQGSSTDYEAITKNGGTAVVDWYIDGVKVFQNSSLTINNTTDGAEIQAKITSDLACAIGGEEESNIIIAEVSTCNGVSKLDESLYTVYPNPTSGVLHVKGTSIETIQVINAIGEILESYKVGEGEFDINTSNYANGIYFIRIHSDGGQVVKEFFKN